MPCTSHLCATRFEDSWSFPPTSLLKWNCFHPHSSSIALDFLAIFPDAELLILVCLRIDPLSVLFTLGEIAFVFPPVWPAVDSEAVLLVILILSLVLAPVVPDIDTHPLHIVV